VNVVELEVRAAAIATENVVVSGLGLCSTRDVRHSDILYNDSVGWAASRASVEVVLLDIDTVDVDVRDLDVTVLDAGEDVRLALLENEEDVMLTWQCSRSCQNLT
jgi:hypothetical protein